MYEFSHLERLPSFVEEDDPTLELMKIYPLGEAQKKQIELSYNSKFRKNPLHLTQEEIEHGL